MMYRGTWLTVMWSCQRAMASTTMATGMAMRRICSVVLVFWTTIWTALSVPASGGRA
jgi:hypothetical protein